IRDIQRYAKTKIAFQEVPSPADVEEIKTNLLLEKVKESIDAGHLGKYINWVERLIEEEYTSLDIAASLLKIVMGENGKESPVQKEDFRDTGAALGMVRFFVNVGKKQKISKRDILGAIRDETGLSDRVIGDIEVFDKFTFVEVPAEYAQDVQDAMQDVKIRGKNINIEPAIKK
ncbi:MAG: DbpA RNA binding domain-containing protein, partial [Candidatus Brocadiales bacterium]|nr:DbpA RNA binding domain-containing protein [Candidatus Brocadiales bacterium]